MTDNSPRAVVARMYELINDGTPDSYGSDRFLELYAEDAVVYLPAAAEFPAGRGGKETLRERVAGAAAVFRNRHTVVHEVVADGDRVVARTTWAATTGADSPGMPAGTRVCCEIAEFFTVKDGLIIDYSFVAGPTLPADNN